jgi:DNA-binding transcriptional LysR family regulator
VLAELSQHSVISFESVSAPTTWRFECDGKELDATFRARLSVNTIDAAIDAGLAGSGIIRAVSYQVAEYVRAKRLALVLENFEPPPGPVHVVYDRQNRLPLKLRAFIDFVIPRLRERLTQAAL